MLANLFGFSNCVYVLPNIKTLSNLSHIKTLLASLASVTLSSRWYYSEMWAVKYGNVENNTLLGVTMEKRLGANSSVQQSRASCSVLSFSGFFFVDESVKGVRNNKNICDKLKQTTVAEGESC